MMIFIFTYLITPNSKKQQNIQLNIITKLTEFDVVNILDRLFFNIVIFNSLNIELVKFVIEKLNINIDELIINLSKLYGSKPYTYSINK